MGLPFFVSFRFLIQGAIYFETAPFCDFGQYKNSNGNKRLLLSSLYFMLKVHTNNHLSVDLEIGAQNQIKGGTLVRCLVNN